MSLLHRSFYIAIVLTICTTVSVSAQSGGYIINNLVSSNPADGSQLLDPTLVDAWGIAIRPPANGLGGHFWISSRGNGTSNQYVGDVGGVGIFQDALKNIDIPPYTPGYTAPSPSGPAPFIPAGSGVAKITGQTWQQTSGFQTTLVHPNGTITGQAKFLFATEDGVISKWTDNKQPDGTPNWVGHAVTAIDRSAEGSKFYGITVSNASGLLFTADLGAAPGIRVFDGQFNERTDVEASFNLFGGANGIQPGELVPFNIQTENINGNGNLFVTFDKMPVAGESILSDPVVGLGKLAEFSPTGELIQIWDDKGMLSSPYGLAAAPSNFGWASNMLLVGNAGDGSIVAFDRMTRSAVDFLRDPSGAVIRIDGLKGLVFGNGMSLGESNQLYFAAGPNGGSYGLFGSINISAVPEPTSLAILGLASGIIVVRRWHRRKS